MTKLNRTLGMGFLGLSVVFVTCSPKESMDVSESLNNTNPGVTDISSAITADPEWANRMSGSPNVHLVSLMKPMSYSEAWVYQFGDFTNDPDAYKKWSENPYNMECGPASVQMIEKLSGRTGVTCDYQKGVAGCEAYPNVHTSCRAIGACGKFQTGIGFDESSYDGTSSSQMRTVLNSLGHDVVVYSKAGGNPVTLSTIKKAIDNNHPVIVALSPANYWFEVYINPTNVDSHFVVVEGYGDSCRNKKYDSSSDATTRGYVYISDPGWKDGALICISEETFNRALDEEYNPSTYTGIEVIRAGSVGMKKATWYPPGTLLKVNGEYYSIVLPDEDGRMRYKHASIEALHNNRISRDRAIEVGGNVLLCAVSLGELDGAVRYREYRDSKTGTIYLVDLVLRERRAFMSYEAYLSYDGHEEWQNAYSGDVKVWAAYPYVGLNGLAPGMLVKTDASNTVWVIERSPAQQRFRLPLANESAATSFGYDLTQFGKNPRIAVTVSVTNLDGLAGPEGRMLTEEQSLDCQAIRCLASVNCFTGTSNIGGGEETIGNGACSSCINDVSVVSSSGASVSIATVSSGGSFSGGAVASGGRISTGGTSGLRHCVQSSRRCTSNPSAYQVCILDMYSGETDWMDFDCPSGQSCDTHTGQCVLMSQVSSGGSVASSAAILSSGASSVGGSASQGGSSTSMPRNDANGGSPASSGGSSNVGGMTSPSNSSSSGGAVLTTPISSGGLVSASPSLHLRYEGPIPGPYRIGGWWKALDGRGDVTWETSLLTCEDGYPNDTLFECDLLMIPSGLQDFQFQIYLPDGRFWGDESCDPTGGCGEPVGDLFLTSGSSSIFYEMIPNPSGAPYYNGWLSVVP